MFKYAQLNEEGYVAGISFLTGKVNASHMILLDGSRENDGEVSLKWKYADGAWIPPEPEPETI